MESQKEVAWLETLLAQHNNKKNVKTVLDIKIENATKEGDNYSSQIQRATLTVLYVDGFKGIKTLIFKKIHQNKDDKEKMARCMEDFSKEIKMYEIVFKYFEQLMNEYQDVNEKLWGDLIGYNTNDLFLILEDLKEHNYISIKRQDLLDLNHTLLVMHGFGRIHALGHVVLSKNLVDETDIGKYYMDTDSLTVTFGNVMKGALREFANVIKKDWEIEWHEVADRLINQEDIVIEKHTKLLENLSDGFLTIAHGDAWTCNMMFKYCPYNKKLPVSVKFIDFQTTTIKTYMLDVLMFLYSSVQPEVRRIHFDQILSTYKNSLNNTLAIYGMENRTPTLEQMKTEVKRLDYYSFMCCITLLPLTSTYVSNAFIGKNLKLDYREKTAYRPEIFNDEIFKEGVKPDLKYWMENGVF